jgi:type IV pilus assembly protein PilE
MKISGFTLIELLITFAIIGILTAIAVPQYSAYRNKEIRTDAVRSMLKLGMELERCRSRNGDGSYTNCPNIKKATASLQGHYTISIALNNNDAGFSMTAAKVGPADLECNTLTLTHDGLRDATTSNSNLNSAKKRIQRCWGS